MQQLNLPAGSRHGAADIDAVFLAGDCADGNIVEGEYLASNLGRQGSLPEGQTVHSQCKNQVTDRLPGLRRHSVSVNFQQHHIASFLSIEYHRCVNFST